MGVSEPIVVWLVNANGALRLDDDEVNAQLQAVNEWEVDEQRRLFDADRS